MFRFMDLANELKERVLEHVDTEELLKMLQVNQTLRRYVLNNGPFSKTLQEISMNSAEYHNCSVDLRTLNRIYNSRRDLRCPYKGDDPKEFALAALLSGLRFYPDFYFCFHVTGPEKSVDLDKVKPFLPEGRLFRRIALRISVKLIELVAYEFDCRAAHQFQLNLLLFWENSVLTLTEKTLLKDMLKRNAKDCEEIKVDEYFSLEDMLEINETTKSRRIFFEVFKTINSDQWFADIRTKWLPKNDEKLRLLGYFLPWSYELDLGHYRKTLAKLNTISKFRGKNDELFKYFSKEWPLLEKMKIKQGCYSMVMNGDSSSAYLHFIINDISLPGWTTAYYGVYLTMFLPDPLEASLFFKWPDSDVFDYHDFFRIFV